MKLFSTGIFLLVMIAACNNTAQQLKERIGDADSAAINYFKGDGTMDTVVAVKIIRDSIAIKRLTDFITGNNTPVKNNCGYDGSIHFFKNDFVVQDIFFSSSKNDCMQFRYAEQGKQTATALSTEANSFLQSLKSK